MKWKLIDRFRGMTALDLMVSVKRTIRKEPKRVYMGNWLVTKKNEGAFRGPVPACGTQACIAGWMFVETAPKRIVEGGIAQDYIFGLASRLLPPEVRHEADNLFLGHEPYVFPDYPYDGTARDRREYANAVIANIDRFIANNRAALKAHKVNRRDVYAGWK